MTTEAPILPHNCLSRHSQSNNHVQIPIPPKYTHERRSSNRSGCRIVFTPNSTIQQGLSPFSAPSPNHSPPPMKTTPCNSTPLIQSYPILPSLDSTHSPNSVMNHLPAHSIRFSSTHSIQMHPFHFDSSLPRSPRRMHNKQA